MPTYIPTSPSPGSDPPSGVQKCAGEESKTTGNRIDIVFDPDKSTKVKKCEKIVHVQFVRNDFDGKALTGAEFDPALAHKDASITSSDGWVVDCLASEKTPDYQQGTGDGKKNGGAGKATMNDTPNAGGGGKKKFFSATNPDGWKKVRFEFAAFAWCMKGPDCGTWYEGITWEYVKTWEDFRDGKPGSSKIIDNDVASGPTAGQVEAFNKFNKKQPFVPCK
jgi:hypothetical protein